MDTNLISRTRLLASVRSAMQAASVVGLVALTGCASLKITEPGNGANLPSGNVAMTGSFRGNVNNSLKVLLDGVDRTPDFNVVYAATPGRFNRTEALAPGQHTLRVTGDFSHFFVRRTLTEAVTFSVAGPSLHISPSSPSLVAGSTANVTISISQAQSSSVPVTLGAAPGGIVSFAPSTAIAPGSTSSPSVALTGLAVGTTTLTASANQIGSDNATITVQPGLTSLSPTQGPVGTSVTFTGTGFAAGSTSASFGGTSSPSVTVQSPTSLTAVVPSSLASGSRPAVVSVNGIASTSRPFTVSAAPPPPPPAPTVLFRTSDHDVQTFTFTPASGATPARLTLVDTDAATTQTGVYTVAVAQTATLLARSSPIDVQAFLIGTPANLSPGATRPGINSGTGAAVAITGSTVVRAHNGGIEVGVLNASGTSISPLVHVPGASSCCGPGVDVLGTTVVRAHDGGIELFDISDPSAPTRLTAVGSGGGAPSSTGTGVRFINATQVVRTFSSGVEVFNVSNPANPTRLTVNSNGYPESALGTAVAVEPGGGAIVRATTVGLERYTLPLTSNAMPTRSANGDLSLTGVGVVVIGRWAFRATKARLEAYDLPALGNPIASIPATLSTVGVGLTGQ